MKKIVTLVLPLFLAALSSQAQTYSLDRNYIATRTYVDAGKYRDAVSYFDERGRPLQQIAVSHTPSGASLLTYFEYDVSDKEVTRMSPIPDSGNGSFRNNFYGYFQNEAENPYGSGRYLPFSRVSYDWGTGTKVTYLQTSKGSRMQDFSYAPNDALVQVPRFEVVSDGLRRIGTYPEGEIKVSKHKDENGNVSMTFTDRRGRVVMTRSIDGSENYDICYVYDNLDNLRYVLPPECVERSYGTQYDGGETLSKYAYINRYDSYGRLIYAKKPSIEPVYLVYDRSGTLVFMQDGNLREQNRWCFSLVDRFGRTTVSGVCANSIDYLNPGGISTSVVRAVRQDDGEFCGYAVEGIKLVEGEALCASYYDDYSFLELEQFSPLKSRHIADGSSQKGLQTGVYNAAVGAEGTDGRKVSAIYYDEMSRPSKTISSTDCGISMTVTQTYDLIDQPLVKTVSYDGNLKASITSGTTCTYDNGGRLVCEQTTLTGFDKALVRYEYDEVDRLKTEILGEGTGAIFSHCTYDERSRLLSKSNSVFRYSLSYDKPEKTGSTKRYDGSVSETSWRGGQSGGLNTYSFHYDGMNRLTDTDRYSDGDKVDEYVEKNVGYNKNSGMTGIVRYYGGSSDSLSFSYDGALMSKAYVNGEEYSFSYDRNGNLIHDGRNSIDISYDLNNQISEVSLAGASKVSYRHFSDGTKYSMTSSEGYDLIYLGPAVFKKSGSSYALESLAFSSGRFETEGMENMPCYYLTDHLGSVRAMASVTAPDESLKSEPVVWCLSDYFPFGLRWGDGVNTRSRYQFNGKENQSKYGVPYLDYGARMYDNYLCRWTACDPVVDYGYDGYSFCHANPVNMVDPDGRFPDIVWDVFNIVLDVRSFAQNIKDGNYWGAAFDAGGLAIDVVAAAIPFVPGGVGALRAGLKAADVVDDAVDVAVDAVRAADKVGDAVKTAAHVDDAADAAKAVRKAPPANEGVAKPHGAPDHDSIIEEKILELRRRGVKDIRKNQVQVDVNGNRVGNNRPDLQWNENGVHYTFEVDRNVRNSNYHRDVITSHDPKAEFQPVIIKTSKYSESYLWSKK